ncbi:hypothetical protein TNCV_2971291, partial [Trichonephila clavipes]
MPKSVFSPNCACIAAGKELFQIFPSSGTLNHVDRLVWYTAATKLPFPVFHHHRAVGSLVVRPSDSRPKGLGSMPDATKYPPSTHRVCARQIKEGVTKGEQTTVKTDMQSDENSGEEGDSTTLEGDRKVIGFLTEWVSAYNFIKGDTSS